MNKSIESILTRSISILSRFLLLTFLAKVLSLSEYGFFQLISYFSIIAISIYGIEYYMYGNREVAKGTDHILKINNHLSFFSTLFPITFLCQLGALYFLIPHEILNIQVVLIILFISFCDYFNQEVYRYLIMVQKISKANLLLLVKSATFLLLVLGYYYLGNKTIDLEITLLLLFGSFILLLIITTAFFLKFIIKRRDIKIEFLSSATLKKTLVFLLPFIVLMVFTKGIEFFDKFAIERFYDAKEVGVYSFLFSIASLTYVFVVSGFYQVYLPEFIRLNEINDPKFKARLIKFSLLIVASSLALSAGIILFNGILLDVVGKTDLKENIGTLYILLCAFFFMNISLIPGIVLYVVGEEKSLMYFSGVIFVVNVILNLSLLGHFGINGAAIALAISNLINFLLNSYKANSVWNKMKRGFS